MQRSTRNKKQPEPQTSQAVSLLQVVWKFACQNKGFTALAASLTVSMSASVLHPNPVIRGAARDISCGIAGVWLASGVYEQRLNQLQLGEDKRRQEAQRVEERQTRREEAIAKRQQELATAENELKAAKTRLSAREDSYQSRADVRATKSAQSEASKRISEAERIARRQVDDAQKRLATAVKDADNTVKRIRKELAQELADCRAAAATQVKVTQEEAEVAIAAANERVETAETEAQKARADSQSAVKEYSEMIEASKAEVEQAKEASVSKVIAIKTQARTLEKGAHQYKQTVHQVLGDERAKVNDRVQSLSSELARMTQELAGHKNLIARLQAPKRFTQSSVEADLGNQIQAFLTGRGVALTAKDIGPTKFGEVKIYFEPINCDIKAVEEQLDALYLHLGMVERPSAFIEKGSIVFNVRISSEAKPKASLINRMSDVKVRQAFLAVPFGLRVTGYTGRGKSTLLNNVIDLYEEDMNTRFTIFDPKVDFPSAEYPKNKVYRGTKKCVDNIGMIGDTVTNRQDYKVLNDEEGTRIPAQHKLPKLFLIDECKDIHDAAAAADEELKASERYHVKEFKRSVQKGLEVGRGLLVRVLYSTVTPDSSDFGFKNSVFKQSATVFVGDQCYEALSSKSQYLTSVSDSKKAQLRQEYNARIASSDARDNFIALFFNGLSNEVFFFSPPAPNAWKTHSKNSVNRQVAEKIAEPEPSPEIPETDSLKAAWESKEVAELSAILKTAEDSPADRRSSPPVIPSIAELELDGGNCPECNAFSNSFKDKNPRKSDNTVRMRCKTKGCPSGGVFRVKVSD